MTTKELIENYFDAIHNGGWESYVADGFVFINSSLDKIAHGKPTYLEGAGKFFKTTTAVEIRKMLIENNQAAVIARYTVRSPKGNTSICDVAEFLTVTADKLTSSVIFFDTKAFAEFMGRG